MKYLSWTSSFVSLCLCSLLSACTTSTTPPSFSTTTKGPPLPPIRHTPFVVPQPTNTTTYVPLDRWIPITYPPDATNYMWRLQESLDNLGWYDIAPMIGTNLLYYQFPPSGMLSPTNYVDVHMGTNTVKFWRMHGIKP